jgi:hypothetical protein
MNVIKRNTRHISPATLSASATRYVVLKPVKDQSSILLTDGMSTYCRDRGNLSVGMADSKTDLVNKEEMHKISRSQLFLLANV